jgi:hypothetical protein
MNRIERLGNLYITARQNLRLAKSRRDATEKVLPNSVAFAFALVDVGQKRAKCERLLRLIGKATILNLGK